MTRRGALALLALAALGACKEERTEAPPPHDITGDAVGEFCGMALAEHPGPKGQAFVRGRPDPVWFASVRELFAYTMLPEYPKNLAALYVTDMARAQGWDRPGPWMDARRALYVVGSRKRGGMDTEEIVPFSDPEVARRFAAENGGRVLGFNEVPRESVLANAPPGEG